MTLLKSTGGEFTREDVLTVPAPITCLAFSSDGQVLAVAAEGGAIRWCDLAKGKDWHQTKTPVCLVNSPAWRSRRHRRLLAMGSDDHTVRLWDLTAEMLQEGTLAGALQDDTFKHSGSVTSPAFSPSGATLASGGRDKKVQIVESSEAGRTGDARAGHTRVG